MSDRLAQIHDRLVWISETEAKAALIKGFGANGEFDPERQRLVEETDRLLDELAAIGGSPKYQPKP
ncbi:MAG: hypothetical protein ACJ8ER_17410 [Allosphingosinicella sp.]